ncbi:glycoside hydrolase family 79 protein [Flagelloscypha sp. PMI_526]|nr:glycoside hydrolase family 79 protein [Flagelloscypha sp. PMI_526]
MYHSRLFVVILLSWSIPSSHAQTPSVNVNVSVPTSPPDGAPSIRPNLLSFSIEQDRWLDWIGQGTPNQFFYNTLDNLAKLTGTPPHIRIGANTVDKTNYNEILPNAQLIFPAPTASVPYPEADNVTVGQAFYDTVRFLPEGTHVTWAVNFGTLNLTAAYLETLAIIRAFNTPAVKARRIRLDLLEIGNEPDLYKRNGHRPSDYDSPLYVQEWTTFATNVSKAAGLTAQGHTKLLAASFAGSSHTTTGFSPQAIFALGILDSEPGRLVSTISEHRYSGSFCQGSAQILQDLMNKASIRGNLTSYQPDIVATKAKGLDFILGETNSYACHGAPNVSNTAGAALWTLDYLLYAPQIGISQVRFHEGVGFKYNLIQPVELGRSILDGTPLPEPIPPHVQPSYTSGILANEAIGNSGDVKAVELAVAVDFVSGYAFYEGGVTKRIVLINLKAFLSDRQDGSRESVRLQFDISGKAKVKRLKIRYADDASGVVYAGQSYETPDARPSGDITEDTVNLQDGIDIAETEALLITLC